jgi:HK97 family phage portal protein
VRGALAALRSNSLENPSTPLTAGHLLSQLDDPNVVGLGDSSKDGPLGVGAALRCVQIISAAIAGCPLRTMDVESRDQVRIPALTSERTGTTPFERHETTVSHIALWGNAYWRKVRTRDGRLVEVVPVHPNRVKVEIVDGRAAEMPYVKRFIVDGRLDDPLTEFDLIHFPGMSIDGVTGVSIIGRQRRLFELANNAEAMADKLYRQGMLLSGFLSTDQPLTEETSTILKDRWRAKLAGIDNAYEVAVLDRGTKFEQLSMSPADAQFLETRKFSTTEIARLFGVPGWMVNDQEKSTSWGSGMEQQFTSFVVLTLKPYMQRIEQRITREVLDPTSEKAEFKVEGLLRGDSAARAAFYASGIQHGWLVPNEPRELEDLKPVEWGDEPYRPYNESAASQAGAGDEPTEGDDQ